MKQTFAYTVDFTRISGKGDFSCPACGTVMSPDDTTEEIYRIVEPKVNSHGLEELVICCNKCSCEIHLAGFSLLDKLSIEY